MFSLVISTTGEIFADFSHSFEMTIKTDHGLLDVPLKKRFYRPFFNSLLLQKISKGCSKMVRCKARDIMRNEAYFSVRRNAE